MFLLICSAIVAVTLFMLGGMIWQALDVEEFPDDQLPRWFMPLRRAALAICANSEMRKAQSSQSSASLEQGVHYTPTSIRL